MRELLNGREVGGSRAQNEHRDRAGFQRVRHDAPTGGRCSDGRMRARSLALLLAGPLAR
jgi:hypothetical protein